jgi:hypothetical protein
VKREIQEVEEGMEKVMRTFAGEMHSLNKMLVLKLYAFEDEVLATCTCMQNRRKLGTSNDRKWKKIQTKRSNHTQTFLEFCI